MSALFPLGLLVILVSVVASLGREGLWSNLVTLFNVIMAGMLATNFYSAAAGVVAAQVPMLSYFADIACAWLIFALALGVFQSATQAVSKVRVKFIKQIDVVGSWFFAIWTGWVFVCFTTFTLHMAPLAREFLWNGFVPEYRMMFGLAPDRKWLGLMHKMSQESFCRLASKEEAPNYYFDRDATFIPMWAARRDAYGAILETFPKDTGGVF